MSYNAYMFADDILLLSLTISDLRDLIYLCKDELRLLDMNLNIKKTTLIRVGDRCNAPVPPLKIENDTIVWSDQLKYLGVTLVKAKKFTCDLHPTKMKFFRSLNSVLAQVASSSAVPLTLKIVFTNCTPVLLYGLEACKLLKTQVNSLTYPYSSVFYKLFNSFNVNVVRGAQFYCGYLPLAFALDLATFKFYFNLLADTSSPAGTLFRLFGRGEMTEILLRYSVPPNMEADRLKSFFWESSAKLCEESGAIPI